MSNEEYEKAFYAILERALYCSKKARREGLLSLEKYLDNDKADNKDIFELGMRFVIDGTDAAIIDKILSTIIQREKDEFRASLKTIQKEAVLAIQVGMNPYLLACLLNVFTDIPLNDPLFRKVLED